MQTEQALSRLLRNGLDEGWAIRTHNRKLSTFRSYGRFLGWTDFLATYKRPPSPPGVPHPIPEGIDGIIKLVEAARRPHHRALLVLQGLCGLRISEVLKVRASHIIINGERVLLHVVGKGNKTRYVPLMDVALVGLIPRLSEVHGTDELLVPLTDRPARLYINRMGKRVLGRDDLASHDLRMTAGTAFFNKSKNIRAVQELLGHASSSTTEIYTGVSMDQMSEAADIA